MRGGRLGPEAEVSRGTKARTTCTFLLKKNNVKETVGVVLIDLPFKEDHALVKMVPLNFISLILRKVIFVFLPRFSPCFFSAEIYMSPL